MQQENTGVHNDNIELADPPTAQTEHPDVDDSVDQPPNRITESELIAEAERTGRARATSTAEDEGRPVRKNRGQFKDNNYTYLLDSPMTEHDDQFSLLIDLISIGDPIKIFDSLKNGSLNESLTLLTEQMSAKKGLRVFGNNGASAIKKELEQLIYRKVMHGKKPHQLTREQKRAAL